MSPARSARNIAVIAIVAAGCGDSARPAAMPTPRATAAQSAGARLTPLVYIWRNFEYTGIPEEMTVYTNGEMRYRNLLHTQTSIKTIDAKLRPGQVAKLRQLLVAADLDR